jgi:hypothetical protein
MAYFSVNLAGTDTRLHRMELNYDINCVFVGCLNLKRVDVGHSVNWRAARCYKVFSGHMYFDRHYQFGWPPSYTHSRRWWGESLPRCY